MRLAFVANHERYFPMADLMIESARKHMPGIYVVHLTDHEGVKHPLADECIKGPEGVPFGPLRAFHHAHLHGDWLFPDVDIVFQKDVWHVFEDESFDMACTSRVGTKWEDTRYAMVMPINNGIMWSRSNDFWKDIVTGFDEAPKPYITWWEQILFNNLVQSGKYRTKILPSAYNFTPAKQDDDLSDALVVHYKGTRKNWMRI